MKTIKLLTFVLLFTLFTGCAKKAYCPAYSDLNEQNQNQTEMKVTI